MMSHKVKNLNNLYKNLLMESKRCKRTKKVKIKGKKNGKMIAKKKQKKFKKSDQYKILQLLIN